MTDLETGLAAAFAIGFCLFQLGVWFGKKPDNELSETMLYVCGVTGGALLICKLVKWIFQLMGLYI